MKYLIKDIDDFDNAVTDMITHYVPDETKVYDPKSFPCVGVFWTEYIGGGDCLYNIFVYPSDFEE